MKERRLYLLFTIFLLISIPFSYGYESRSPEEMCKYKLEIGERNIEVLDWYISKIQGYSEVLYGTAVVINGIDTVMTTLGAVFGFKVTGKPSECCVFDSVWPGLCDSLGAAFSAWQNTKERFILNNAFKSAVHLATCGCCGRSDSDDDVPDWCPADSFPKLMADVVEENEQSSLNEQESYFANMNAFDNIYVATGCMCPVAILYHLKKMKAVYQTYLRCIEGSCDAGISPQVCDEQLDRASCIYFWGSADSKVSRMIAGVATTLVSLIVDVNEVFKGLAKSNPCTALQINVKEVPDKISSTLKANDWLDKTFEDVEPIGLEELKSGLISVWSVNPHDEYVLIDNNSDNIYEMVSEGYFNDKYSSFRQGKVFAERGIRDSAFELVWQKLFRVLEKGDATNIMSDEIQQFCIGDWDSSVAADPIDITSGSDTGYEEDVDYDNSVCGGHTSTAQLRLVGSYEYSYTISPRHDIIHSVYLNTGDGSRYYIVRDESLSSSYSSGSSQDLERAYDSICIEIDNSLCSCFPASE